jgi:hypothetical protein
MLEARRHLDLAIESLDADSRRELGRENLQGDRAAERHFLRDENAGHAAAAELAFEPICITKRGLDSVAKSSVHQESLCGEGM